MEGTNNYTNPYEAAMESQRAAMEPPKKKNKIPGIILLVIGAVSLLAGVIVVVMGGNGSMLETAEPVDIYLATEPDEYAYTSVQYMTEYVASYEAMENMRFYIVCDSSWNPTVICLHTDEFAVYQPYIDWLYSDSYENPPEEMSVTGYSQPFDEELIELVIEGFAYDFGEGIVDESNFYDWFGEYYLQVGQKNNAYGIVNTGIFLLIAAVILFVTGGILVYEKPVTAEAVNGPIIQESRVGLGILGAFLGALLGGLLWTLVGALGYVSGWVGILIVILSNMGYGIMARKKDKIGLVVSIIFSVIIVIPATYLYYGWSYYRAMNEAIAGYTTLTRALLELPAYLTNYDGWTDFAGDLLIGYVFMVVSWIYSIISTRQNKN